MWVCNCVCVFAFACVCICIYVSVFVFVCLCHVEAPWGECVREVWLEGVWAGEGSTIIPTWGMRQKCFSQSYFICQTYDNDIFTLKVKPQTKPCPHHLCLSGLGDLISVFNHRQRVFCINFYFAVSVFLVAKIENRKTFCFLFMNFAHMTSLNCCTETSFIRWWTMFHNWEGCDVMIWVLKSIAL